MTNSSLYNLSGVILYEHVAFRGFLGVSQLDHEWFAGLKRGQHATGSWIGAAAVSEVEVNNAFDYLHRYECDDRDFRFINFTAAHKEVIDELLAFQRAVRMATGVSCLDLGDLDCLIEEIGGPENIPTIQTAESYLALHVRQDSDNREALLS